MQAVYDSETRRCLIESAVNFGTLLTLLEEKGIISNEEFEKAKIRVRAEMDQQLAERDDANCR